MKLITAIVHPEEVAPVMAVLALFGVDEATLSSTQVQGSGPRVMQIYRGRRWLSTSRRAVLQVVAPDEDTSDLVRVIAGVTRARRSVHRAASETLIWVTALAHVISIMLLVGSRTSSVTFGPGDRGVRAPARAPCTPWASRAPCTAAGPITRSCTSS